MGIPTIAIQVRGDRGRYMREAAMLRNSPINRLAPVRKLEAISLLVVAIFLATNDPGSLGLAVDVPILFVAFILWPRVGPTCLEHSPTELGKALIAGGERIYRQSEGRFRPMDDPVADQGIKLAPVYKQAA